MEAVSFSVLVEAVLAGVKLAVTPAGSAPIARAAAPVKPFSGVTVTTLVPVPPCVTLKIAGAAANVKLGPGFTVRERVTEVEDVPEAPVTVTAPVPSVAADVALRLPRWW